MVCRFCIATTKKGKSCKRSAMCKKGCSDFCWQHAMYYSKTKKNVNNKKLLLVEENVLQKMLDIRVD